MSRLRFLPASYGQIHTHPLLTSRKFFWALSVAITLLVSNVSVADTLTSREVASQETADKAPEIKTHADKKPTAKTPVVKTNALDNRVFDYFELENQLKVLLVSDTSLQKAAAAIDVHVGAGEDPADIAGLAHFLEHMLFLGTEKYPDAGSFQTFISNHGGSNNAYTSVAHTNYYFDVDVSALEEALDRFSEFFITPQFNESLVDRERKAVHSEYTSKYILDSRRTRDVFRELAHPDHPIANFTTGNKETLGQLKAEALRKELIRFYKTHYSSNIMTLVVAAPLSIDELKAFVDHRFNRIPNHKITPVETNVALFEKDKLPLDVRVLPNKETRKLSMIFPVGDAQQHKKLKPLEYIGNFIGHEGAGSLLSVLKEKEWATGLNAGGYFAWRDGETFAVNIRLTPEGLKHVNVIEALVFDYIALLKHHGVQAWRFDELSRIHQISFNFAESGNTIREVSHLANQLQTLEAKDIYFHAFNWERFDASIINSYLDKLNSKNVLTVITDPDTKGDRQAYYYQTPYTVKKRAVESVLSDVETEMRVSIRKQLALPEANPYISKDFSIHVPSSAQNADALPKKIIDSSKLVAWYLNDNTSDLPKAVITARFKLPETMQTVDQYVQLRVLLGMLQESLNEESYAASLAGLSYSLSTNTRGFDLEFYGYNDALGTLYKRVVKRIQKVTSNKRALKKLVDTHFDVVKLEMLQAQKNKSFDKLYSRVLGNVPPLLYDPFWSVDDVTAALETLDKDTLISTATSLFKNGQATVFVFGNYREKDARAIAQQLKSIVRKRDKDAELPPGRVLNLSGQPTLVHSTPTDSTESVVVMYYQGRTDSVEERAAMLVLEQCLSAPFYHSLRTEQQLGYVVSTMNYAMRKVPGMMFLVQSPNVDAGAIHKAISEFAANKDWINEDDVAYSRKAVLLKLNEPPQSQWQWSQLYWSSITELDERFESKEKLIEAVNSLRFEDVVQLHRDLLLKGAPSAIFFANEEGFEQLELATPIKQVSDYLDTKRSLPRYSYH